MIKMQYKILCNAYWLNESTQQWETRVVDSCETALNGKICPHYQPVPGSATIDLGNGRRQMPGACIAPRAIIAEKIGLPQLIHASDNQEAT